MKTAKGESVNQNVPSFFRFSKSTLKVLRSALLIIRKKKYLSGSFINSHDILRPVIH